MLGHHIEGDLAEEVIPEERDCVFDAIALKHFSLLLHLLLSVT